MKIIFTWSSISRIEYDVHGLNVAFVTDARGKRCISH